MMEGKDDDDLVEFINATFPTYETLTGIDDVLKTLNDEIGRLDVEIHSSIKDQAKANVIIKQEMSLLQQSTLETVEKVTEVLEKSEKSSSLIKTICSDIKNLDDAKKGITLTISSLKKLMMLINAIGQFRGFCLNKQYDLAANSLSAINDLLNSLNSYKKIEQIEKLQLERNRLCGELKLQIMEDVRGLSKTQLNSSDVYNQMKVMEQINEDALFEYKQWFCKLYLENYTNAFRQGTDGSELQNTERRYSWLKTTLKDFKNEQYCKRWHLQLNIALEFCSITREQLSLVLSSIKLSDYLEIIIRVLHNTQFFEKDLTTKFNVEKEVGKEYELACYQALTENGNTIFNIGSVEEIIAKYKAQSQTQAQTNTKLEAKIKQDKDDVDDKPYEIPNFLGKISSVFNETLSNYAEIEKQRILEALNKLDAGQKILDIEDQENPVFISILTLFAYISGALNRTLLFSTSQSLYDLCMEVKNIFEEYIKMLKKNLE